ncbi:hypothetical protein CTAYLR_002417 [Chrysophaeum taylorii]|uniref:DUF4116 domain-containing protein n=1 Tax=Chrysophaeum taylorii TaxID=2483200 RepID=A0AAD7XQY5_9STRA|nr:hypothetical protein CTAYLR_002417 [Chrysophaeum taylorii]
MASEVADGAARVPRRPDRRGVFVSVVVLLLVVILRPSGIVLVSLLLVWLGAQFIDQRVEETDKRVVLAAVQHCGGALQGASDELRADKELVLAAVRQDGRALEYADATLRNDKDVVLAALHQDGRAFEFVGAELKEDKEIVLAAGVTRRNNSRIFKVGDRVEVVGLDERREVNGRLGVVKKVDDRMVDVLFADGLSTLDKAYLRYQDPTSEFPRRISDMDEATFFEFVRMVVEEADHDFPGWSDRSARRPIVACIGKTGAGKSTAINFLAGCKTRFSGRSFRRSVEQDRPLADTGSTRSSCTIKPKLYPILDGTAIAIDTPGSFDTGGQRLAVYQMFWVVRMLRRLGRLDAILIVSSADELIDERQVIWRLQQPQVEAIRRMFPGVPTVVAVTKADKLTELDDDSRSDMKESFKRRFADDDIHVVVFDYSDAARVIRETKLLLFRTIKASTTLGFFKAVPLTEDIAGALEIQVKSAIASLGRRGDAVLKNCQRAVSLARDIAATRKQIQVLADLVDKSQKRQRQQEVQQLDSDVQALEARQENLEAEMGRISSRTETVEIDGQRATFFKRSFTCHISYTHPYEKEVWVEGFGSFARFDYNGTENARRGIVNRTVVRKWALREGGAKVVCRYCDRPDNVRYLKWAHTECEKLRALVQAKKDLGKELRRSAEDELTLEHIRDDKRSHILPILDQVRPLLDLCNPDAAFKQILDLQQDLEALGLFVQTIVNVDQSVLDGLDASRFDEPIAQLKQLMEHTVLEFEATEKDDDAKQKKKMNSLFLESLGLAPDARLDDIFRAYRDRRSRPWIGRQLPNVVDCRGGESLSTRTGESQMPAAKYLREGDSIISVDDIVIRESSLVNTNELIYPE